MSRKKVIIILGMHRSGTSLVAELVNKWGAYAGDEPELMPANQWNQQGYWEYMPMVQFNMELLQSVAANWTVPPLKDAILKKRAAEPRWREKAQQLVADMERRSQVWLWKDPRLVILLPFWEEIWQDATFIIPIRHPAEVAHSLKRRDGFSIQTALLLWQYYTVTILNKTEHYDGRLFMEYERLLAKPTAECRRLCVYLDEQCGASGNTEQKVERMSRVVNPALRSHHTDSGFCEVSDEQKALYDFLKKKVDDAAVAFEPTSFTLYPGWGERIKTELLFQQGIELADAGRFAEALTLLSRLLEINQAHFETLQLMGDFYHDFGKKAEAQQMWQMALALQPADRTLRKKLGMPAPVNLIGLKQRGDSVDCSIIVPVFNQLHFTRRCLELLQRNTPGGCYEIIVVDNHSTDGTAEYLAALAGSDVRVISNAENLGFSKACNQGARAARNEFILFLNNDVEVQPGWLAPLVTTLLGDPDVAVAGAKLLYPDGKIQHAGVVNIAIEAKRIPLSPYHIYHKLPGTFPDANVPREYAVVTGACLLTRKSVFDKLGGFDESYRNGYEDVDYCYRVGTSGRKVVYRPESVAIHYESQSGPERFTHENANFKNLVSRWHDKVPVDIRKLETGELQFLRPFKTFEDSAAAIRLSNLFSNTDTP